MPGVKEKESLAREASRILAEPMIQDFFLHQKHMCFEALNRLPMGSKLEEYQTIHHDLLAVERLETMLKGYIENYDNFLAEDSRKDVAGV